LVIPNEKIFKVIDSSTPIVNAFSTVNKSLIESLESLIDLIYNPGIINIDFADLRTILKGKGNTAFINTVEESGKERVEKTCENIFKNPLLQSGSFKAEKILFNIAGAESLSMFEVEKISTHIANLNPNAKIIFGISKDNKLKSKIKTTILMTDGPIKEEVSDEKPKDDKKKIKKVKPKKEPVPKQEQKPVSFIPVFEVPEEKRVPLIPVLDQKGTDVVQVGPKEYSVSDKKTIRRSGLEIRRAEELQEKKKIAQEKEWEIPAFLRKVKFKN